LRKDEDDNSAVRLRSIETFSTLFKDGPECGKTLAAWGDEMTKILFIRHGHVEGIKPERFRGRADLALTKRGDAEAEAVGRRVAQGWEPRIVYTSPLKRCVATGAAISQACGIESRVLDELQDIHYGAWQFRTFDEVMTADPERFAAWLATPHLVRFPDGESLQELAARTADALRFVLDRHLDDTVVLVSHDSANRALLLQLLDQSLSLYWHFDQEPCCINEIDFVSGRIRIVRINETAHLGQINSA
jgi:phosphoserine phosphatase